MTPKVKRTYARKEKKTVSDSRNKRKAKEEEKENKRFGPDTKSTLESENEKNFDKVFKSPLNQKVDFKPLGFWSQKLKNLETENSFTKPKNHGLYEFSGTETDESGSPFKRKKKVKRKPGPKKNKVPSVTKPMQKSNAAQSLKKIKQIHSQSMFREQITLHKEREKLANRGEKFTFSTGITSLGISSTPAVNKDNLVGASNFQFISPIKNEVFVNDVPHSASPNKLKTPKKPVECETPKIAEKRISCRRVLRNGKIL